MSENSQKDIEQAFIPLWLAVMKHQRILAKIIQPEIPEIQKEDSSALLKEAAEFLMQSLHIVMPETRPKK